METLNLTLGDPPATVTLQELLENEVAVSDD